MKISCIIIEDEKAAAEILELYISKIDFLHLRGVFSGAIQALSFLNAESADLIFTDIELPGISGINFIKTLSNQPGVILVTAYPEYAIEGFEVEAIDFLVKPVSFERFVKAVNRFLKIKKRGEEPIRQEIRTPERAFVFIKCDKKMVKLYFDEILYFEAQKNYLLIYTENETLRTYYSISEMEEKLPEQLFIRIHRSFIVSVDKVKGYTGNYLDIGHKQIPIGRSYNVATLNFLRSSINS